MIKYLKKLWRKYFRSLGYSRIKEVKHTTALPVVVLKPQHCVTHTRFKKSCPNCQEIIK
jgi:hypothetical protein